MNSKGKYIGISNRIPLIVLEYAVNDYICTGQVNAPAYFKYIQEFTKGENRAKKTLTHITTIINKNISILSLISKKSNGDFTSFSSSDRKAILICLYSLTFPITYDILIGFAAGFKVQEIISKRVILEKIGSIYGSNRSMHIGVDETIPLLLDCLLLSRQKIGIYAKGKSLKVTNNFIAELIIYTHIKLSVSNSILVDEIGVKPWFSYFEISNFDYLKFDQLLIIKDSAVGKGYVSIK